MQIFSPCLSTSPFSSPLLPFSSSPHIYDWYLKKFCHRKCFLHLTFLKKTTHFSQPFRKCRSIFFELMIAENPELPHKTSLVTPPVLKWPESCNWISYLFITLYCCSCGWHISWHFLWFSVTSQVQYYLYNYNSPKVSARLHSMDKVIH